MAAHNVEALIEEIPWSEGRPRAGCSPCGNAATPTDSGPGGAGRSADAVQRGPTTPYLCLRPRRWPLREPRRSPAPGANGQRPTLADWPLDGNRSAPEGDDLTVIEVDLHSGEQKVVHRRGRLRL